MRDYRIGQLSRLVVEIIPCARLFGAERDTVCLQHTVTDEAIVCEGVETLKGTSSNTALADALADWPGEMRATGDELSPRTAEESVLEGLKTGMAVGA